MRARFIRTDGSQFFDEVFDPPPPGWWRVVPTSEEALSVMSMESQLRRTELFCRQFRFVPCGPMCCPVGRHDLVYVQEAP